MAWGLNKEGFKRPNQADLKADMDQRSRELFGDDINLSAKSPLGLLILLFSWFLAKVYELAEKVYQSGFISTAEGIQLDYLAPFLKTSRMTAQYAEVLVTFTGTPNFTILAGTRFETEAAVDFELKEDVTLDASGNGFGEVVCLTVGTIGNVPSGSITVQSEPSADIFFVTNVDSIVYGREEEEQEAFRSRMINSVATTGSGTINAILASVLEVPGVRAANITVNNTSEILNGQPPHSNHVFALGGEGQAIAEAIFANYTGMQAYGSDSFTVKDISGNDHIIAYTPATAVNIFSNVTVTTDNTFQANGITQVKDAVIKIIGGTGSDGTLYTGLNMGADVIYSKVIAAVISVQGVTDAMVTIGKSAETQGTTNIAIESNEVAQISAVNIEVTAA